MSDISSGDFFSGGVGHQIQGSAQAVCGEASPTTRLLTATMGPLKSSGKLIAFWTINSEPHTYLELPDKLNVYGKLDPPPPLPRNLILSLSHSFSLARTVSFLSL